jgi:hypothetical protein
MRVDGPSTPVVGFSNYTQKIAADAVNPDLVSANKSAQSSTQFRAQSQDAVLEQSLKNRESYANDVVEVRAQAIELSQQSKASSEAAEQARSSFEVPAYEKGSIIDTFA